MYTVVRPQKSTSIYPTEVPTRAAKQMYKDVNYTFIYNKKLERTKLSRDRLNELEYIHAME